MLQQPSSGEAVFFGALPCLSYVCPIYVPYIPLVSPLFHPDVIPPINV